MKIELLKTLGQISGIAGFSIGFFFLLFGEIIRKKIFPQLNKQQGFRLLVLILVLSGVIALAGIGAWVWSENKSTLAVNQNVTEGTGVVHIGQGDVNIENNHHK